MSRRVRILALIFAALLTETAAAKKLIHVYIDVSGTMKPGPVRCGDSTTHYAATVSALCQLLQSNLLRSDDELRVFFFGTSLQSPVIVPGGDRQALVTTLESPNTPPAQQRYTDLTAVLASIRSVLEDPAGAFNARLLIIASDLEHDPASREASADWTGAGMEQIRRIKDALAKAKGDDARRTAIQIFLAPHTQSPRMRPVVQRSLEQLGDDLQITELTLDPTRLANEISKKLLLPLTVAPVLHIRPEARLEAMIRNPNEVPITIKSLGYRCYRNDERPGMFAPFNFRQKDAEIPKFKDIPRPIPLNDQLSESCRIDEDSLSVEIQGVTQFDQPLAGQPRRAGGYLVPSVEAVSIRTAPSIMARAMNGMIDVDLKLEGSAIKSERFRIVVTKESDSTRLGVGEFPLSRSIAPGEPVACRIILPAVKAPSLAKGETRVVVSLLGAGQADSDEIKGEPARANSFRSLPYFLIWLPLLVFVILLYVVFGKEGPIGALKVAFGSSPDNINNILHAIGAVLGPLSSTFDRSLAAQLGSSKTFLNLWGIMSILIISSAVFYFSKKWYERRAVSILWGDHDHPGVRVVVEERHSRSSITWSVIVFGLLIAAFALSDSSSGETSRQMASAEDCVIATR